MIFFFFSFFEVAKLWVIYSFCQQVVRFQHTLKPSTAAQAVAAGGSSSDLHKSLGSDYLGSRVFLLMSQMKSSESKINPLQRPQSIDPGAH